MITQLRQLLETCLTELGADTAHAVVWAQFAVVICLLLFSLLLAWILYRTLVPLTLRIVEKTETKWDDYLINRPVLHAVCRLVPSLLVYNLLPLCFDSHDGMTYTILYRLTQAYIAVSVILLIGTFLKNLTTVTDEMLKKHHMKGILDFLRVLNISLGLLVTASLLLGYNPVRVIAGLGAAATVLMLVFKDTLLGLVAGIQLSAYHMMKVGDWITIPKLNVNGTVEEMSLTTVKVRNFDNTISTIPPYTLVSDSFQNWNGMQQLGLRRVKRALYIDVQSISFVSRETQDELRHRRLISKADAEADRPTNLTLFRHHIADLLHQMPDVSSEEWILVRQLDPTPGGLPLELWFYLKQTEFVRFEELASTIFETLIALAPDFGLRLYQAPAGSDFARLTSPRPNP